MHARNMTVITPMVVNIFVSYLWANPLNFCFFIELLNFHTKLFLFHNIAF